MSGSPLTIDEGDDGRFTVRLKGRPSDDVTVTLTQPTNTDVTVDTHTVNNGNQTTLKFTTSNWNVAQAVTVTAGGDADSANDSATISLSASGGGFDGVTGSVPVTVTDDGGVALKLSKISLFIIEGGRQGTTFTVELKSQPQGTVTVTLTEPGGDLTLDKTSLTFYDIKLEHRPDRHGDGGER